MKQPDKAYLLASLDDLEDAGHRAAAEYFRWLIANAREVREGLVLTGMDCKRSTVEGMQADGIVFSIPTGEWTVNAQFAMEMDSSSVIELHKAINSNAANAITQPLVK